jgi:hypothetical protein
VEQEFADNGVVVIDDFLTPLALAELLAFSQRSTVFNNPMAGGYLGAYHVSGFSSGLFLQVAFELQDRLPSVLNEDLLLKHAWAYKYNNRPGVSSGISEHADEAKVTVNLWITPDSANRNSSTGGLVIHCVPLPPTTENWVDAARDVLRKSGTSHETVTVPYRQNRAVVFKSSFIHHTDVLDFHSGYRNRRINLSLMFGDRT